VGAGHAGDQAQRARRQAHVETVVGDRHGAGAGEEVAPEVLANVVDLTPKAAPRKRRR
jgi:hypothetical protein